MGAQDPLGHAGSAVSMYISYPGGGTGKLTIDPDRVEVFITYMEQALDRLRNADELGRQLVHVDPPGDDPFSPSAVEAIRRTAGDEPGGHLYANRRAQEAFQAIIDSTKASLAAYREQEARGVETFRGDR